MNYFIEGLQGSGKSTLVNKVSGKYAQYRVFREGDYSPVELAWCAYATREKYAEILDKYRDLCHDIEEKSHEEGDRIIICYTQILTDTPGFHKDLEQYEIYNNRMGFDEWKAVLLKRYRNWNTDGNIFECSLFQNIVEDMILFRNVSDREIIEFYKEIRDALQNKDFRILYLMTEDIEANIGVIRKERSDDQGNELWYPLMIGYFNDSPYALKNGVSGDKALLAHLKHRQELELKICEEVFPERYTILKSKEYSDDELF